MKGDSIESRIMETMRMQMKLLTTHSSIKDLTLAQLGILNIVEENPGIGISELAAELHVKQAAITQHIVGLEE